MTCKSLSLIFQKKGYDTESATTGKEALEITKRNSFNIALLDLKLPDMEGIELISPIKKVQPECTVIMVTGFASLETSIKAMNAGAASYITKPLNMDEVLLKLKDVVEKQDLLKEKNKKEEELQQTLGKLRKAVDGIIHAMALMLEVRDPYTAGHQRRATLIAAEIAREIGLKQAQQEGLRMAGMIHDIGKVYVPSEILSKPGRLTEAEFQIIKTHPQVGCDILKNIEFPYPVANTVLQHHEKLDGSGYPQGLSGKDILKEAKVLCVADVVEAMSSHRPYRPALGIDKTLAEIKAKRGDHFDPEVVDACLKLFKENGFSFDKSKQMVTFLGNSETSAS